LDVSAGAGQISELSDCGSAEQERITAGAAGYVDAVN